MRRQNEDINGFPIITPTPNPIVQDAQVIPGRPLPDADIVPVKPLPLQTSSIDKITINGEPLPVENKVVELPIATTEQYGVTQLSNEIEQDSTKAATPEGLYTLQLILNQKISELEQEMPKIYYHTKEYWDQHLTLVSEENAIYVYTNYQTYDGKNVAGIKVGDGLAYLIDLPFTDEILMDHINNFEIHITQAEREFWNNKVRSYMSDVDNEELIFTIH